MAGKWTFFEIIVIAAHCGTRAEFKRQYRHAYNLASKQGLLDSLFPATKDKLTENINRALALNNATLFRKRHPAAARMLSRYGYRCDGIKYPENSSDEQHWSPRDQNSC